MTDIVVIDDLTLTDECIVDLANRVRERAIGSEEVTFKGSHYHFTVEESAIATDGATAGLRRSFLIVSETAEASETLDPDRFAVIPETATATDSVLLRNHVTMTIVDGAQARDSVIPHLTIVVLDSAEAADTVATVRSMTVEETATATDLPQVKQTFKAIDGAVASDAVSFSRAVIVSDSAEASEAVTISTVTPTFVDSGVAQDAAVGVRRVTLTIMDGAVASDTMSATGHYTSTVVESATAEDGVVTNEDAPILFWNNAHNAAAALWQLNADSMIEVNGRLFAATEAGIVELVHGLGDDGEAFDSEVLYDLMNLGADARKRLTGGVYIEAEAEKPFTVTVANSQGRYRYKTMKTGKDQRMHRAEPGLGLETVKFRIGLKNSADFQAGRVRADYDIVKRSV